MDNCTHKETACTSCGLLFFNGKPMHSRYIMCKCSGTLHETSCPIIKEQILMADEKPKIDFTKPVRTSGGWEVEIYNAERRHGAVRLSDGWRLVKWGIHGQPECQTYGFDLVQKKKKVVFYKNIYMDEYGCAIDNLSFNSRLSADRADEDHKGKRFACVRIEAEEGRFDE